MQEQAANERCMSKKSQAPPEQGKETKKRTPTFLLELPLQVNESQAARLRAHLEAGRQFYNAVLSEGQKRLRQMRIENKRMVQRQASSLQAKGADALGFRYAVQLVLEGVPHHKPKHPVGSDIIGADLGPSTIALFPREGEASLSVFCEELAPNEQAIRRLQRKMDRQRTRTCSIPQEPACSQSA
jgi:hypothetical protein